VHDNKSVTTTWNKVASADHRAAMMCSITADSPDPISHPSPTRYDNKLLLPSTIWKPTTSASICYRPTGREQLGRSEWYVGSTRARIWLDSGKLWGTTASTGPAVVPQMWSPPVKHALESVTNPMPPQLLQMALQVPSSAYNMDIVLIVMHGMNSIPWHIW
jgi:hypothetical protein